MTAPRPSRSHHRPLLRRSLEFVAGQRRRLAWITVLALLTAGLGAIQPLILKRIFDALGARTQWSTLRVALVALVAVEFGRAIFTGWLAIATWNVRLAVEYRLRERLLGKLNTLPMSFHQAESVGGLVNRLNQSVTGYVNAFSEIAFNMAPAMLYLAMSIIALLDLDWRLALAVLVFAPIPVIVGALAAREQTTRERRLMEQWTSLYSRLNEVLSGIRTVKAFAMEEVERRRFLAGQHEGIRIVQRGVRLDTITGGLRDSAATFARLAAIALGAWLIVRDQATVGTLVAILGYIAGLFGPVQGLTNVYQTLRRGTVALEVIYEILDAPDAVADPPGAMEVETVRGAVRFENVSFAYDGGPLILDDVSFGAEPGETVAIVGPSGSGKSTLMQLLQRLYPLRGGRITVDGIDIRRFTQRSLRAHIGIVYQDVSLFNDPVRDNIAYGRPSSSDEEIADAARAAQAHDFVEALPQGYDTVVGEHGSRLSGGQRQRIGIARALLFDPPILVLDEATSALDAESEAAVQLALRALTRGRTTFVIAHRLSTIVDADRIVVLRDGRVEAIGRHEALLRSNPWYASVVRLQSQGMDDARRFPLPL